mmetsp:Transcript_17875/g.55491  ORF Transcript_17875/g.55491 Transcript_17875/m.55491 type:complete len:507 (-) Transcript_17875:1231-2751(-)
MSPPSSRSRRQRAMSSSSPAGSVSDGRRQKSATSLSVYFLPSASAVFSSRVVTATTSAGPGPSSASTFRTSASASSAATAARTAGTTGAFACGHSAHSKSGSDHCSGRTKPWSIGTIASPGASRGTSRLPPWRSQLRTWTSKTAIDCTEATSNLAGVVLQLCSIRGQKRCSEPTPLPGSVTVAVCGTPARRPLGSSYASVSRRYPSPGTNPPEMNRSSSASSSSLPRGFSCAPTSSAAGLNTATGAASSPAPLGYTKYVPPAPSSDRRRKKSPASTPAGSAATSAAKPASPATAAAFGTRTRPRAAAAAPLPTGEHRRARDAAVVGRFGLSTSFVAAKSSTGVADSSSSSSCATGAGFRAAIGGGRSASRDDEKSAGVSDSSNAAKARGDGAAVRGCDAGVMVGLTPCECHAPRPAKEPLWGASWWSSGVSLAYREKSTSHAAPSSWSSTSHVTPSAAGATRAGGTGKSADVGAHVSARAITGVNGECGVLYAAMITRGSVACVVW